MAGASISVGLKPSDVTKAVVSTPEILEEYAGAGYAMAAKGGGDAIGTGESPSPPSLSNGHLNGHLTHEFLPTHDSANARKH